MTSTAAFPLVRDSLSKGMYAISLHGSNSEYLADLDIMFWNAPTSTASMSGVVPRSAVMGVHISGAKIKLQCETTNERRRAF